MEPKQLDSLLHPQFDADRPEGRRGHRQGPGRLPGRCLRPGGVHRRGRQRVLPRRARRRSSWSAWRPPPRTSRAWPCAQGILTVRGGMTSHAAVVARGMGTCCVSGCGDIVVDYDKKCFTLGGKTYTRGRLDLHRRLHRQHLRRGHPHRARPPSPAISAASWAGPTRARKLKVLHQRRQPPRRQAGRRVRRGGHRPVPHRAYVL